MAGSQSAARVIGHGRRGAARRVAAPTVLLAFGAALVAVVGARGFLAPSGKPRHQGVARAATGAEEISVDSGSLAALRRRDALSAAAAAAAVGVPLAPALAEQVVAGPPARLQRVVINVGDKAALDAEIKFWTEACLMKKLYDVTGADGLKSTVVSFGEEKSAKGGASGVEIKVDPAVLTRPLPKLLNYAVMQPTVDALNFVQVGAKGKSIEIFRRVQNSGGNALFGDSTYVDVESPRGVPVRLVVRDEEAPGIEVVSLNIEVPAFEPTVKFYKRSFGLKEFEYPDSEPPVQKKSVLLQGDGGPDLLLSPVPDGRLKERPLDEFENLVVVANDQDATSKAIEEAVSVSVKEEAEYDDKLQSKLAQTPKGQQREQYERAMEARRKGTRAKPSIKPVGGSTLVNDGVGNFLVVSSPSEFDKVLASSTA